MILNIYTSIYYIQSFFVFTLYLSLIAAQQGNILIDVRLSTCPIDSTHCTLYNKHIMYINFALNSIHLIEEIACCN